MKLGRVDLGLETLKAQWCGPCHPRPDPNELIRRRPDPPQGELFSRAGGIDLGQPTATVGAVRKLLGTGGFGRWFGE